jgi:hypothetical protein
MAYDISSRLLRRYSNLRFEPPHRAGADVCWDGLERRMAEQ